MTDLMDRPAPAEKPRIDPRIAKRWIDARRQEGRRRLQFLMVLGALVGCLLLAVGSLFTPLFQVRHVRISVDGPLPVSAVARLAGVTTKTLTVHLDAAAVARRLDADPWLGAARVARHWPGTVTISVGVRSPLAVVALPAGPAGPPSGPPSGLSSGPAASPVAPAAGPGWAEVDATGRVLADVSTAPVGLPVLQGVRSVPAPGGWLTGSAGPKAVPAAPPSSLVDMSAASDGADVPLGPAAALAFLRSLPPLIRADVLSLNVGAGPGLSLVISPPRLAAGTVTVLLGDGSELQAKVTALMAILGQGDLSGTAGLDLSVPSRPATASSLAGLAPPATAAAGPAAAGTGTAGTGTDGTALGGTASGGTGTDGTASGGPGTGSGGPSTTPTSVLPAGGAG